MTHQELRQRFYARITDHYLQGEMQALYHWCAHEIQGWSRAEAYLRGDDEASEEEQKRWNEVIERLINKEPVQYIFGKAPFMDFELKVSPAVLIPRPETEELVELVLSEIGDDDVSILDIGTGSGCIPIALKRARPNWKLSACDISAEALALAEFNARSLGAEIDFFRADALQSGGFPAVDYIVSNPPYIPRSLENKLERNVRDFEPHLALFAPDENPFIFFTRIAAIAEKMRCKGVFFETHATQENELVSDVNKHWLSEAKFRKDSYGKNRFLVLNRGLNIESQNSK